MKKKLCLTVMLRPNADRSDMSFYVLLPVRLAWWESTRDDLHLQFEGHDGNILPQDNQKHGEMKIPRKAKQFRAWLKSQGFDYNGAIYIWSNMLEMKRPSSLERDRIPPPEALADLINNWKSPNA